METNKGARMGSHPCLFHSMRAPMKVRVTALARDMVTRWKDIRQKVPDAVNACRKVGPLKGGPAYHLYYDRQRRCAGAPRFLTLG